MLTGLSIATSLAPVAPPHPQPQHSTRLWVRCSISFVVRVKRSALGLHSLTYDLDDSRDEKDTMGVESTMAYLENLGVDLENAEMLVVAELLQSPSIGAITKKGYIDGWKTTGYVHTAHISWLLP